MTSRSLSARDAEKVLGIPAATVRSWHHRRARTRLESVGVDRRGHPLFREEDLVNLRDRRRLKVPAVKVISHELGRHFSAKEAEETLGIPAARISLWHHRRRTSGLFPGGVDRYGRKWFYEADLIVIARGQPIRDSEGQRIHTMNDLE